MENPRPEKVAVVDEVRERLSSSSAVLLTEYRGLKVSELAALRRTLRAAGGDYKVYKNTLVRFAVRELDIEGVEELLVGPTALAFVDGDAAAVAKTLRDYGRTNPNMVLKGGILGGKALSADEARALADLPSREVLLARIAGGLAAPMQQFASLLQALPRNFAYGLKALIEQNGGVPEAVAEAEPVVDAPVAEAEPVADEPAVEAEPASEPQPFVQVEVAEGVPTGPDAAATDSTDSTDSPEADAPSADETAEEA